MQPAPPQSATDAMTQSLHPQSVQSDATPQPHEHPHLSPQTYIFTGGGSGGHVNPALAIADGIRSSNPDARIEYIGARGKIEAELVPARGYPIHLVHARGLPTSKKLLPLAAFSLVTGLGILQCLLLLLRIKPDVIVATGGYASSPVLFALWILRSLHLSSARCFIHEQNVVPGLVNRIAGRIADRIGVSFLETARYFHPSKVVHVGYPIRKEISTVHREQARQDLKIPEQSTVVFAFGGSQGARSINRGLVDALPELLRNEKVHIFHVIGIQEGPEYHAEHETTARIASLGIGTEELSRYHSMRYAHDIQIYYAASDVIIGRAGAGTVTEICAGGRPSILIPLPNAPGDHQALNARTLESGGAAFVLYEEAALQEGRPVGTVDGHKLSRLILELDASPDKRNQMGEAARRLFDNRGLERIMHELTFPAFTPNKDSSPNSTIASDLEIVSTMTSFQLLRKLDADEQMTIESIGQGYLRYKADGYLTNVKWQVRNVGVKIVGILKYQEKLPLLLSMLSDRTPVSRIQRLFGGDYQQVGFIRRNILRSVIQLNCYNIDVRNALLDAFTDPYFEVRSTAAQAAAMLADQFEADDHFTDALLSLTEDKSFEVVVEAIRALGKTSVTSIIPQIRHFYLNSNWKIREAILLAMADLTRRGVITDSELIRTEMANMLITCVDFQPVFPIKKALNELANLINQPVGRN